MNDADDHEQGEGFVAIGFGVDGEGFGFAGFDGEADVVFDLEIILRGEEEVSGGGPVADDGVFDVAPFAPGAVAPEGVGGEEAKAVEGGFVFEQLLPAAEELFTIFEFNSRAHARTFDDGFNFSCGETSRQRARTQRSQQRAYDSPEPENAKPRPEGRANGVEWGSTECRNFLLAPRPVTQILTSEIRAGVRRNWK